MRESESDLKLSSSSSCDSLTLLDADCPIFVNDFYREGLTPGSLLPSTWNSTDKVPSGILTLSANVTDSFLGIGSCLPGDVDRNAIISTSSTIWLNSTSGRWGVYMKSKILEPWILNFSFSFGLTIGSVSLVLELFRFDFFGTCNLWVFYLLFLNL